MAAWHISVSLAAARLNGHCVTTYEVIIGHLATQTDAELFIYTRSIWLSCIQNQDVPNQLKISTLLAYFSYL